MTTLTNIPDIVAFNVLARTRTAIFFKAAFTSTPDTEVIQRATKSNGFPPEYYGLPQNIKIIGRHAFWNTNNREAA